jgi:hypothetical protein
MKYSGNNLVNINLNFILSRVLDEGIRRLVVKHRHHLSQLLLVDPEETAGEDLLVTEGRLGVVYY